MSLQTGQQAGEGGTGWNSIGGRKRTSQAISEEHLCYWKQPHFYMQSPDGGGTRFLLRPGLPWFSPVGGRVSWGATGEAGSAPTRGAYSCCSWSLLGLGCIEAKPHFDKSSSPCDDLIDASCAGVG